MRFPFLSGSVLLLTLILSACSRPVPTEEPIRAVKTITVGTSPMQSGVEFAAEVRARTESRLGFRVAGKMVRRQAEVGQRVRVGQVLAELDPQDYQLSAQAARAQVAVAQTNRDLAAADFKRFKELRDQNFISSAELDRRDATLKAAQSQLEQAQAQLAAQGNQADYARLLADAPGVVMAVEAEPGQVVAAGAPVVRLARDGARDVVFSVPEDRVAQLRVGAEVQVQVWASAQRLGAKVREVAVAADPVTRTFLVRATISGREVPALGSTVTVLAKGQSNQLPVAIKLPTSALRQEGQATAVWVLETASMTVRLQPIQIATADGNEVVVAGGLTPGMQVVSAGVHVLSPGQKVTIYKEKSPLTPVSAASAAIGSIAATATAPATPTAPAAAASVAK
jgi:RND family efflux transporter MFP subunit